jgi:hypothetical protein
MKFIFYFFISCFLFINAYALDSELYHLKIQDSNGNHSHISIDHYINPNGILEVRIDAAGIPKIFNKLNPTIAYGRDLDNNGKIDTWFFITKSGIEVIQGEGSSPYGLDILPELIMKKHPTSIGLYFSNATTTALSYLFFTASEAESVSKNFYYDWINLEELSIQLENERKNPKLNMNQFQFQAQGELISTGYKELAKDMDKFSNRDLFGYIALDVAAWFTGGVVLKWGGKLLSIPLKKLSETTLVKYLSENITSFLNAQHERLLLRVKSFKEKIGVQAVVRASTKNWRTHLNLNLRAISLKSKLLQFSKNVFTGAKSEWKYIALNIGIQTASETYAHYDDVVDSNPLMMAKNVLTNPDIEQNIGFMTLDTVLMTGVSRNFRSSKIRFMACGFVALHDSSLINFVIKKDNDYKRIAMDTSWEMFIGNAQVQMDLTALTFFEKLAKKHHNSKLKLIGYAFAIVDQAIGYVAYSKTASAISPSPILVPVFAEN